jgi:hypothetical protein
MCCSASPDASAEPAPLRPSRGGGASSDRDRRDLIRASHVACGMWRTWRHHETDTKSWTTINAIVCTSISRISISIIISFAVRIRARSPLAGYRIGIRADSYSTTRPKILILLGLEVTSCGFYDRVSRAMLPRSPGRRSRVACGRRINPRAPARPRAGVAEAARRAASSVDGCTAMRTPPPSPLRRAATIRIATSTRLERRSESVAPMSRRARCRITPNASRPSTPPRSPTNGHSRRPRARRLKLNAL